MNRRSKGFTLTELLTALVIHSFFILMLGGTFYTLISFGSRSQMVTTARERGQRVINYIDSRVQNVGLGMWDLESSSAIREALKPLTEKYSSNGRALYNSEKDLTLPVVVTFDSKDNVDVEQKAIIKSKMKDKYDLTNNDKDKGIYCGNVLILLYAQRETGTDSESPILNVYKDGINIEKSYINDAKALEELIKRLDNDEFWIDFFTNHPEITDFASLKYLNKYKDYKKTNPTVTAAEYALDDFVVDKYSSDTDDDRTKKKLDSIKKYNGVIKYLSSYRKDYPIRYKYLYKRSGSYGEFYYSDFGEQRENNNSVEEHNIRAWGVSRGAGKPFTVNKYDGTEANKRLIRLNPRDPKVTIPDGDELLYLKGVRVFATDPTKYDKDHGQPLRNLKIQKLDGEEWGSAEPYQQGILELYAELNTTESILTVWVLSTGGRDNMTHERPKDWPGRWREEGDNNDYKYLVTYVSKGTWKLNNLHRNESDDINFTWD